MLNSEDLSNDFEEAVAKITAELPELCPDEQERDEILEVVIPRIRRKFLRHLKTVLQYDKTPRPELHHLNRICFHAKNLINHEPALYVNKTDDPTGYRNYPVIWRIHEEKQRIREKYEHPLLAEIKDELAKKGITDKASLFRFTKRRFQTENFGKLGTGLAIAKCFMSPSIKTITVRKLDHLCWKLKFDYNPEKEKEYAISMLNEKGINNLEDLMEFGPERFAQEQFGDFANAQAFFRYFFPTSSCNERTLHQIAQKIGWLPES